MKTNRVMLLLALALPVLVAAILFTGCSRPGPEPAVTKWEYATFSTLLHRGGTNLYLWWIGDGVIKETDARKFNERMGLDVEDMDTVSLIHVLNKAGEHGWEAVSHHDTVLAPDKLGTSVFLKRRKRD